MVYVFHLEAPTYVLPDEASGVRMEASQAVCGARQRRREGSDHPSVLLLSVCADNLEQAGWLWRREAWGTEERCPSGCKSFET